MTAPRRPAAVVVGTGFGLRVHVPALRAAGYEVAAIVGRDPERTARRAARAELAGAPSLAAALAGLEGRPVLVTVATPPDQHAPVVLEALAAGAHVLCEKPFALDAAEARVLAGAAERAGVIAAVGHEFRFAQDRATLARALAQGRIGRPVLAAAVSMLDLVADPGMPAPAWWFDAARGGGWLGASGSHAVDQWRQWLGEFRAVSAQLTLVSARDADAEDSFTLGFETVGGTRGLLEQCAASWGPAVNLTRVVGDAGTLWLEDGRVGLADRHGQQWLPVPEDLALPAPDPEPSATASHRFSHLELGPYRRLVEWLGDAIAGERPWPPPAEVGARGDPVPATFRDGVRVTEVLDAARRSSGAGGAVVRITDV